MPIRPELRHLYANAEARRLRAEKIAEAEGKCRSCGAAHEHLNAAHETHDPKDSDSIVIWCPSCHARHDAPHRIAVMRRTQARRVGQLWLLPEIEFSADPWWLIPARAFRALQQSLFQ